jgi:hypothetical protein
LINTQFSVTEEEAIFLSRWWFLETGSRELEEAKVVERMR